METLVFQEDLEAICAQSFIPWERLRCKTIFVTGATGLIGASAVKALLFCGQQKQLNLEVIALVRDEDRARALFASQLQAEMPLRFVVGDVTSLPELDGQVSYIIHGASPTASRFFVDHPVETIQTAVCGTGAVLELARKKQAEGVVYLSSMEVYGAPHHDRPLREEDVDYMNPLLLRNSYPESKRLCENLCVAYAAEYEVPVSIARLSQTFGPGISKEDNRVFAQFMRSAREGRDIILRTKGDSTRTYVYTMDAVSAIVTLLLRGKPGEAYNVANAETYCSVLEMAQMVAEVFSGGSSQVRIEENDGGLYPPRHCYRLNPEKLRRLGWQPRIGLEEMYRRMLRGQD